MVGLLFFLLRLLLSPFRPISRLEAENAALRRQLIVLQRQVRGRVQFANSDRLFFLQLYRWFPSIVKAMTTIRPETLVRWHRAGFCRYWRWKSRNLGGRPPIDAGLRALIRRMSTENMLWGAPRIRGELLKLGFAVAQSTVAKYMARTDGRRSGQSWGTFLRNHLPQICGHAPITSHGHPRQTDFSGLAVAEFVCREVDRNDPSRVRGPHRRAGRGASASYPERVRSLLQYRENTPVIGPGCAGLSPGSADRTHRVACPGWRAASPISPDLGFRHAHGSSKAISMTIGCCALTRRL
jgi:hypothetical protein